jgi:hypothetical protein
MSQSNINYRHVQISLKKQKNLPDKLEDRIIKPPDGKWVGGRESKILLARDGAWCAWSWPYTVAVVVVKYHPLVVMFGVESLWACLHTIQHHFTRLSQPVVNYNIISFCCDHVSRACVGTDMMPVCCSWRRLAGVCEGWLACSAAGTASPTSLQSSKTTFALLLGTVLSSFSRHSHGWFWT